MEKPRSLLMHTVKNFHGAQDSLIGVHDDWGLHATEYLQLPLGREEPVRALHYWIHIQCGKTRAYKYISMHRTSGKPTSIKNIRSRAGWAVATPCPWGGRSDATIGGNAESKGQTDRSRRTSSSLRE